MASRAQAYAGSDLIEATLVENDAVEITRNGVVVGRGFWDGKHLECDAEIADSDRVYAELERGLRTSTEPPTRRQKNRYHILVARKALADRFPDVYIHLPRRRPGEI